MQHFSDGCGILMSAWLSDSYSPEPPRLYNIILDPFEFSAPLHWSQLIGTQKGSNSSGRHSFCDTKSYVQTTGKCTHLCSSIAALCIYLLVCMVKLILDLSSQTCTKLIIYMPTILGNLIIIIVCVHIPTSITTPGWASLMHVCWWCIVRVVSD